MTNDQFTQKQVDVFQKNCDLFAQRVACGSLNLLDAADMLQGAAELAGLVEVIGQDAVQAIMARAFTGGCQHEG